jgi:coenzyme F420 hydrogenase subunit delta
MSDMPEHLEKSVLIFGCGNVLFGDDGFGPAVADELMAHYDIPDNVAVFNAGTSIRTLLFDIVLYENKPQTIVVVDAVDMSRNPGDIFEIDLDDLPENKIDDFSMHQLPTSNLLRELRDLAGVDVRIMSCQIESIPEEVAPGLSETLQPRVKEMCELIVKTWFK